ncbi:hypothetical protein BRYFOR_09894 [Marvinbryantia formatexigens DSM 14469]|uniref:Uncharacterized protein n=1 Tax=Marvinbryantia formatexigens DSM 14469 TaxID=478749 RepID=C6LMJ4_9FIRM|nr:hypothetical protein BRYFOR_09894 [Marvinbryantia formatexigens DSM 14469]
MFSVTCVCGMCLFLSFAHKKQNRYSSPGSVINYTIAGYI